MPPPRTATVGFEERRRAAPAVGVPASAVAAPATAARCSSSRREMSLMLFLPRRDKLTMTVVSLAYAASDELHQRPAAPVRRHQRERPRRGAARTTAGGRARALWDARLRRDRRQGPLPGGRPDRPLLLRVVPR